MAERLLLGIEGGATRTTGMLADSELHVLAERIAGPTNVHAVGEARARAAAGELVEALRVAAGAPWQRLAASAFCIAGIRGEADRALWRRIVADLPIGGDVLLTHDAAAGLAAGSPHQTGILVVCGTGSIVYGRRGDGREHFVGGGGPVLGDEASGFDIGRRGLRAAMRAADRRGPETSLTRLIPRRVGVGAVEDLVAWAGPFAKDRIASVAPIVFEAAEAGDRLAKEIVQGALEELVRSVRVVHESLWPPGRSAETPLPIVLSGGVLRAQPGFREALAARLSQLVPGASCAAPTATGALGAVLLAQRHSPP
jgi:N-acetylglucosamine kinase-like BadF-type ATPase